MTTKRTHQCNFCRADIKDQDGNGFVWCGERLDAVSMREAENHLCGPCGRALSRVLGTLFQQKQAA